MSMNVNRLLLVCSIGVLLASGCHNNKDAEGPMERAGKNVDRAAKESGQELRKAAKKTGAAVERATEATGEAFEKAGKKLQGNDAPPAPPKPAE
jgi:hypothetical protein